MADFTIGTTADFDSGTKSDPGDGNYGVETLTDNPSIIADVLELANRYASNYNKSHAGGTTWKDRVEYDPEHGSVGCSTDIDTTTDNALHLGCAPSGTLVRFGNRHQFKVDNTVGWEYTVSIDVDPASSDHTIYLTACEEGGAQWINYDNYAWVWRDNGGTLGARIRDGASNVDTHSGSLADTSFKFRIKSTVTGIEIYEYHSGAWTLLCNSAVSSWPSEVLISVSVYTDGTNELVDILDYQISWDSALTDSSYRTTGNWTSDIQTLPADKQLSQLDVSCLHLDVTRNINKIEILDNTDTVLTTTTSAITSDGVTTLEDSDFDNGLGVVNEPDLDSGEFKVKVYLEGDGNHTPRLQSIEGTYGDVPAGAFSAFDGFVSPFRAFLGL